MSIHEFSKYVLSKDKKAKIKNEDGKHIAYCSEGVKITGNTYNRCVTVTWGDNHVSLVRL